MITENGSLVSTITSGVLLHQTNLRYALTEVGIQLTEKADQMIWEVDFSTSQNDSDVMLLSASNLGLPENAPEEEIMKEAVARGLTECTAEQGLLGLVSTISTFPDILNDPMLRIEVMMKPIDVLFEDCIAPCRFSYSRDIVQGFVLSATRRNSDWQYGETYRVFNWTT